MKGEKVNTELLINGQFEKGASDSEDIINPTNGDLISTISQASKDQVDKYDNPKNLGWDKIEQTLNLFK